MAHIIKKWHWIEVQSGDEWIEVQSGRVLLYCPACPEGTYLEAEKRYLVCKDFSVTIFALEPSVVTRDPLPVLT